MLARLLTLLLVAAMPIAFAQSTDEPVTVRMMFGNTGSPELHQRAADMFMEEHPGIRLEILEGPEQTDDLLALYADFFDTESPAVDVIQVDTIWPGFIAPHLIDLFDHLPEDVLEAHIQPIAQNNLVDERLVAIPWFTDVGVLYYRTDLLEAHGFDAPPSTWDELEEMAATILEAEREDTPDLWGFVFQGDAYEGLTVDAIEWIASHGGGTIVDRDGAVTIDNPNAVTALEQAAGWIGDIAPEAVTGFNEEESRQFWQRGDAIFLRNWPYVYGLATAEDSAVAGNVGVARLPAGSGPDGRSVGVLGGWSLGVTRYSEHPEEAAMAAAFFASERIQKLRAVEESFTPTIESLYEDAEVLDANPFYEIVDMRDLLANAVPRPAAQTGQQYFEISRAFYRGVHDVLTDRAAAAATLEVLALDIEALLESD